MKESLMKESLCYLLLVGCLLGKAAAQNQQPLNSSTKDHTLPDVEVVSQYIESTRKTPISVSTVSAAEIGQKIGVRPLPYALQRVPSLYVRQGNRGENGAQIYLRGFDQSSIGLLLNGTPISDMEYGRVFWSQWGMLARFAQNIQVQKGLGASKTIVNSVGGSINVLTQNTSLTPSATVEASYGSQNTFQTIVSGASGLLKGNWMVNAGFGYEQTDGYNEGTAERNYFYFATVSKSINRNHHLSLTVLGSPTRAANRFDWGSDALYENASPTLNPYGNTKDKLYKKAHLPFAALTHKWMINDKMNLQSAAYFTMRNAKNTFGEVSMKSLDDMLIDPKGKKYNYNKLIQSNGKINPAYANGHHINFDKIQAYNSGVDNPWANDFRDNEDGRALVIIKAVHSDYKWFGGVSSFNWDILPGLNFVGGVDLRYYTAEHYSTLDNLLGAKYHLDLNPWATNIVSNNVNNSPNKLIKEGDRIDYAYQVDMFSTGTFGQLEYRDDYISSFVSVALSNTGYKSKYFTQMFEGDKRAITPWYNKFGFNTRMGISYNFTPHQNIYWNGGVFSKAPYIDVVFINNGLKYNNQAKNEKIYSTEVGYGFQLENFTIQAGAYYTLWTDRARDVKNNYKPEGGFQTEYRGFMYNTAQQHYGVELETQYVPTKYAQLSASAAWGDWRFTNNPSGNLYADNNPHNPIFRTAYIKDLKVPNAPQLSANFGVTSNLYKGLYVGLDASYFDLLYADINVNEYTLSDNKKQMWRMPAYYLLDGRIGWENIKLAKNYFLSLQLSVLNLTDHKYISEAQDGKNHNKASASYFYGNGATYLATAKFQWKK